MRKHTFTKDDELFMKLQVDVDEFHLLYLKAFGTKKVSIYLKLLFQGVILQQLLHFGNLAIYDQETAEANQKVTKVHIRTNTNQHDPAADMILIYSAKFIFLCESQNESYPFESKQLNARLENIRSLTEVQQKHILSMSEEELIENATARDELDEGPDDDSENERAIDGMNNYGEEIDLEDLFV